MRVPFQRPIAVLLAPILFVGCYNYVPVEPGTVSPGTEVRARVAAQAAAEFAATLGLTDARLLDGTLVEQRDGGVTLSVQTSPQGTVGALNGIFQNVSISRAQLLELESVKIDRVRTGITIGIVAVGIGLATSLIHGNGTGAGPTTEPPPSFNIGLWHFRF